MSAYLAALTAAGTAITVGVIAMARSWPQPASPAPQPMLRPVEALDQFEARCPIEQRQTLHVRFSMGGVQCLECRRDFVNTEYEQGD